MWSSKYPSKYQGKFCPAIGNTGPIPLRYQLSLCFLTCELFFWCMKHYFRASFMKENLRNTGLEYSNWSLLFLVELNDIGPLSRTDMLQFVYCCLWHHVIAWNIMTSERNILPPSLRWPLWKVKSDSLYRGCWPMFELYVEKEWWLTDQRSKEWGIRLNEGWYLLSKWILLCCSFQCGPPVPTVGNIKYLSFIFISCTLEIKWKPFSLLHRWKCPKALYESPWKPEMLNWL